MCSLVMSLCSCDLHVMSLNNNTLNSSRLTVVQLTQRLVFGWYNINLLNFYVIFKSTLTVKSPSSILLKSLFNTYVHVPTYLQKQGIYFVIIMYVSNKSQN